MKNSYPKTFTSSHHRRAAALQQNTLTAHYRRSLWRCCRSTKHVLRVNRDRQVSLVLVLLTNTCTCVAVWRHSWQTRDFHPVLYPKTRGPERGSRSVLSVSRLPTSSVGLQFACVMCEAVWVEVGQRWDVLQRNQTSGAFFTRAEAVLTQRLTEHACVFSST